MDKKEIATHPFVFTIGTDKKKESDRFLSESILAMHIAGQLALETNNEKVTMKPGNILLVRKHQFVKVTKSASDTKNHKAIFLTLNEGVLSNYNLENRIQNTEKYNA